MKFISYQERRNKENILIRRYKVYNFLFFKIKKKVLPVFGENNTIIIGGRELTEDDKQLLDKAGKITIVGNNNVVELADITNLNCNIWVQGNNNRISIGKCKSLTNIHVSMPQNWDNRELIINDFRYFQNVVFSVIGNNRKIHVGKDCMFSSGINVWTTDFHPIYDLETNKRVNEEQDIIIGDHVWLGREIFISKGSIIPSGCVIGAKSFVNKAFTKENTIIAGIPAKVVKENIRWE